MTTDKNTVQFEKNDNYCTTTEICKINDPNDKCILEIYGRHSTGCPKISKIKGKDDTTLILNPENLLFFLENYRDIYNVGVTTKDFLFDMLNKDDLEMFKILVDHCDKEEIDRLNHRNCWIDKNIEMIKYLFEMYAKHNYDSEYIKNEALYTLYYDCLYSGIKNMKFLLQLCDYDISDKIYFLILKKNMQDKAKFIIDNIQKFKNISEDIKTKLNEMINGKKFYTLYVNPHIENGDLKTEETITDDYEESERSIEIYQTLLHGLTGRSRHVEEHTIHYE